MKREMCSACGGADLETFLDLGESPIADAYTTNPGEPTPRYPLQVAVCGGCRLVQLLEVVDQRVLFGTGYSFYSSASPPLSAYHADYAADVLAAYPDLTRRGVLEVGCNDGDLLRHFAAAGCPAMGVDPAEGPGRVAVDERKLQVVGQPFTAALAGELGEQWGRPGVVVANHVLAHVEDVSDMLAGMASLVADDGRVLLEVQYLPDLLVNNAFDLVYHEHRNFFSLTTLCRAAARHGLQVVGAQLTDRQGGSVRVTLKKAVGPDGLVAYPPGIAAEEWLEDRCAYQGMQGRAERIRDRLRDLLAVEEVAGRVVAGYGAPAKATTLMAFCQLGHRDLDHIVDTTVAKQGRYVPGTRVRIVPPPPDLGGVYGHAHADSFVLFAWNYATPIIRANPGRRWLVPIPAPVMM